MSFPRKRRRIERPEQIPDHAAAGPPTKRYRPNPFTGPPSGSGTSYGTITTEDQASVLSTRVSGGRKRRWNDHYDSNPKIPRSDYPRQPAGYNRLLSSSLSQRLGPEPSFDQHGAHTNSPFARLGPNPSHKELEMYPSTAQSHSNRSSHSMHSRDQLADSTRHSKRFEYSEQGPKGFKRYHQQASRDGEAEDTVHQTWTVDELYTLARLDPKRQICEFQKADCRVQLTTFLRSTMECFDPTKMRSLLHILAGLVHYEAEDVQCAQKVYKAVFRTIMSTRNCSFHCGLTALIQKMPLESSSLVQSSGLITDMCKVFEKLLEVDSPIEAVSLLPIDGLYGSVKQLAQQDPEYQKCSQTVKALVQKRNEIREKYKSEAAGKQEDSEKAEDSTLAVLPSPEELACEHLPDTLRKNKVKGALDSPSEYLSIHYKLLREDFIHPLRYALHDAQEDSQDVKTYEEVTILESDCLPSEGIVFKVRFRVRGKPKWDRNKKLIYGSLLCLSPDDFRTVIFATVANRDAEELKKGIATIRFQNEMDGFRLSSNRKFRMIESPGYFEAYVPILQCLKVKERNPDALPFTEYLVECNISVKPPAYLRTREKDQIQVNLKEVLCTPDCEAKATCAHSAVEILSKDKWSDLEVTTLNASQKEALQFALTHEITLIQGPPGTGKTFIGLKIIKALLQNKQLWDPLGEKCPIVVLCYTNHALDQFLEGVIDIYEQKKAKVQIRRIGGRSKSLKVDHYNLRRYIWRKPKMKHREGLNCAQKMKALQELLKGDYVPRHLDSYLSFFHPSLVAQLQDQCELFCLSRLSAHPTAVFNWLGIPTLKVPPPTSLVNYPPYSPASPSGSRSRGMFHNSLNCYDEYEHSYTRIEEDKRKIVLYGEERSTDIDDEFQAIVDSKGLEKFVRELGKVTIPSSHTVCRWTQKVGVHKLHNGERMKLFKYCLEQLKQYYEEKFEELKQNSARLKREEEDSIAEALKEADVIGLTTTGAAKYNRVLSKVEARIVIIEEAAEVLEAHVIAALTQHTEHLVLIGDEKQLRPKTNEHLLARDYHLDVSMFERLIKNGFPRVSLNEQHRMRPEISQFVSTHIYPGVGLKDHDSVLEYENIRGMLYNLYCIDHQRPEELDESLKSPTNPYEARFLAELCQYLMHHRYSSDQITVLTPYRGQDVMLKRTFRERGIDGVHITPVDNYQGEENDIILLSLVRSNPDNNPGFVRKENRICVALSRARKGFYCIGNFSLFDQASGLWHSILTDMKQKGRVGTSLPLECVSHKNVTLINSPEEFHSKSPEHGCEHDCGVRLQCGHMCPRKCHPDDQDHIKRCSKPCAEQICERKHRCPKKCYEPCDRLCYKNMAKVIPKCGHKQMVPCYQDPDEFMCKAPCEKPLKCGHQCNNYCGAPCTEFCKVQVKRQWPCGHTAAAECSTTPQQYLQQCKVKCSAVLECEHICGGTCGKCHQGRLHRLCSEKCTRQLLCGHNCSSKSCARNCPPCPKRCDIRCCHGECNRRCKEPCIRCVEPCKWQCPHHKCENLCWEMCERPRCNEPCKKKLKCRHPCLGLCGEPCPPVCRQCDKGNISNIVTSILGTENEPDTRFIKLTDCKHIFEVEALDKWMDTETDSEQEDPLLGQESHVQIAWKCCPICKKPILTMLRYGNITRQTIQDMNEIKRKRITHLEDTDRGRIKRELQYLIAASPLLAGATASSCLRVSAAAGRVTDEVLERCHIIFNAASIAEACKHKLESLSGYITLVTPNRAQLSEIQQKADILVTHIGVFIGWLKLLRERDAFTDQVEADLHAEERRILLLTNTYKMVHEALLRNVQLSVNDRAFLDYIRDQFETDGRLVEKMTDKCEYDLMMAKLRKFPNKYPSLQGLTEEEKRMIITTLGAKPGSWYKCPKGHVYHIGDCGGAMQIGKCPECGANIGGQNHHLLSGNAHAQDFDSSQHAAWSAGANLLNYDPAEIRRIANDM